MTCVFGFRVGLKLSTGDNRFVISSFLDFIKIVDLNQVDSGQSTFLVPHAGLSLW